MIEADFGLRCKPFIPTTQHQCCVHCYLQAVLLYREAKAKDLADQLEQAKQGIQWAKHWAEEEGFELPTYLEEGDTYYGQD